MVARVRVRQLVWLAAAAGLLVGAGAMHAPLDNQSRKYELTPPGGVVDEKNPQMVLLTVAPGGLRAIFVNYLWIRAQTLKEQGRFFDAMQRAEMICNLQPRFPSVWSFLSWDLAWNISVAAHTPQERWRWVYKGVELLRDRGIPKNPDSLMLYKDLGWIFFSKMGGYTDQMHLAYKQRWAAQMQHLLGAPPCGKTAEVIAAFRPIAEAPLDKDPLRQGRYLIQPDMLAELLSDKSVRQYAELLAAAGVEVNESLLAAYNRWSMDEAAVIVRSRMPIPKTDADKKLSALINDPAHAAARKAMLSFVRAQVLWNKYKLDPAWMLGLMVRYNIPLDWRMPAPHGLYWTTYGMHLCNSESMATILATNTDRIVLNCLKDMSYYGRLGYEESASPDWPRLVMLPDYRYIAATHAEHVRLGELVSKARNEPFSENLFKAGHINYLVWASQMLYARHRRSEANKYFRYIKETYKPKGPEWKLSLAQFIFFRLNQGGRPIHQLAQPQIAAAILAAYEFSARGNVQDARSSMQYAIRVYNIYRKGAVERMKLRPFGVIQLDLVRALLIRPQIYAMWLPLTDRSRLYASISPQGQLKIYDSIAPALRRQCEAEGLDFDKAFPAPPGLEEYRERQRQPF